MLDNQEKIIFLMKLPYLGENQRVVRRLFNQMSSFRMETYLRFLNYVKLEFAAFYARNSQFEVCLKVISSPFRAEMKTQYFADTLKVALVSFAYLQLRLCIHLLLIFMNVVKVVKLLMIHMLEFVFQIK